MLQRWEKMAIPVPAIFISHRRDDTLSATGRLADTLATRFGSQEISDETVFRRMLSNNKAPDFILDRGHTFGSQLQDADKWALIEYLKTF